MSDPRELPTRFWDKISVTPSGCWEWTAFRSEKGYGQFAIREHGRRRTVRAHRYAYEILVGPIPSGLTLDHLCRNRACVDPSHLEPVAVGVNVLRGNGVTAERARSDYCPNGHLYDLFNTDNRRRGWRTCRICNRAKIQRRQARRNEL